MSNNQVWANPYQSRFGSTEIQKTLESKQVTIAEAVAAEAALLGLSTAEFGINESIGEILESKELVNDDKETPPVYIAYFIENGGKAIDFEQSTIDIPQFEDEQSVLAWLSKLAIDPNNKQLLLYLASLSQAQFIDTATQWYEQGAQVSDKPDDSFTLININPTTSVDQLVKLQAAKKTLRDFAVNNKETNDDATKAWIAIYMSKINGLLADQLPRMRSVVEQAGYNQPEYDTLLRILEDSLPIGFLSTIMTIEGEDRMNKLYRRLDYVRNGFADNESKHSTVVDEKIVKKDLDTDVSDQAIFSAQQVEYLQSVKVTPQEVMRVVEKLFAHYGLAEKGWTYGINTSKRTYAVDSKRKRFEITQDVRSLVDTISVGLVHEFSHVFQSMNEEAFPYKIGSIKGKRSGGIREAGAIANEAMANKELFGIQSDGPSLSYGRAIESLEHGGSPLDAVAAFAQEKDANGQHTAGAAKIAADRVIRLIRKGFNSQPMVYDEGQVFRDRLQQLGEAYPGVGADITSLDIADQIRLQTIGALPKPESNFDIKSHLAIVTQIVLEEFSDAVPVTNDNFR